MALAPDHCEVDCEIYYEMACETDLERDCEIDREITIGPNSPTHAIILFRIL